MFAHDEVYDTCWGENPPTVLIPPRQRGEEKHNLRKIAQKTACREYVRPSRYMSEFRRDVSDIPSRDRGSQRRKWPSKPGVPFGEAQRVKRREEEGGGAGTGGTHHGTSAFGLSCRQHLL